MSEEPAYALTPEETMHVLFLRGADFLAQDYQEQRTRFSNKANEDGFGNSGSLTIGLAKLEAEGTLAKRQWSQAARKAIEGNIDAAAKIIRCLACSADTQNKLTILVLAHSVAPFPIQTSPVVAPQSGTKSETVNPSDEKAPLTIRELFARIILDKWRYQPPTDAALRKKLRDLGIKPVIRGKRGAGNESKFDLDTVKNALSK